MTVRFEMTPACLKAANDSIPQLLRNLSTKMLENDETLAALGQLFNNDAQPVQVTVRVKTRCCPICERPIVTGKEACAVGACPHLQG